MLSSFCTDMLLRGQQTCYTRNKFKRAFNYMHIQFFVTVPQK